MVPGQREHQGGKDAPNARASLPKPSPVSSFPQYPAPVPPYSHGQSAGGQAEEEEEEGGNISGRTWLLWVSLGPAAAHPWPRFGAAPGPEHIPTPTVPKATPCPSLAASPAPGQLQGPGSPRARDGFPKLAGRGWEAPSPHSPLAAPADSTASTLRSWPRLREFISLSLEEETAGRALGKELWCKGAAGTGLEGSGGRECSRAGFLGGGHRAPGPPCMSREQPRD